MTPFAVMQRAARLAPELDRMLREQRDANPELRLDSMTITVEEILRALWRAGLTLDADLHHPGHVIAAMRRLGISPTGPTA